VNQPNRSYLVAGIAANLLLLVTLLGYLASMCVPASEETRLRNALLLRVAQPADIEWTPAAVPRSFKTEQLPASQRFRTVVADLGVQRLASDWQKALALASHLALNAKDLGPIQADLETTYEQIVGQGRGYCADFTKVYLGLAHAAGIFAREWAFSFDAFGGDGHAFVEVFDRQRGRWLWLDVYNNVHGLDTRSGEPLSAAEFRSYVLGERSNVAIERNGPGRLGYVHPQKLIDYYRRGAKEWYLWAGNDVFTYARDPAVRIGESIAPAIGQGLAIVSGLHPRILVAMNASNAHSIEKMQHLRIVLLVVLVAVFLLCVLLFWQCHRLVYLQRERSPRYRGTTRGQIGTKP